MRKFVSISGGADSTALALLLWERGEDFELIFADTGAEFPENYYIITRLQATIQKPLHVVSGGGFYHWLVKKDYMLPGPRKRWCTRILKQEPIDHFLASFDEEIEVCQGIRADEPRRVRSREVSRPGCKNLYNSYPLVEAGMCKKDVFELCKKYDLLNPVYKWRSNVSCFCCFFQRKSDWLGLLKHHPELYALAEQWEKQSYIMGKKKGLSRVFGWNQSYTLENLRRMAEKTPNLFGDGEEIQKALL